MADEFCLKMPDFHVIFRDLLHAVNLLHGTYGFTSLPEEGVLRIFSPWKIRRLRSGLNPRTWVPKASTLLLDHRSCSVHTSQRALCDSIRKTNLCMAYGETAVCCKNHFEHANIPMDRMLLIRYWRDQLRGAKSQGNFITTRQVVPTNSFPQDTELKYFYKCICFEIWLQRINK